jgi:hypothetical protein
VGVDAGRARGQGGEDAGGRPSGQARGASSEEEVGGLELLGAAPPGGGHAAIGTGSIRRRREIEHDLRRKRTRIARVDARKLAQQIARRVNGIPSDSIRDGHGAACRARGLEPRVRAIEPFDEGPAALEKRPLGPGVKADAAQQQPVPGRLELTIEDRKQRIAHE